MSEKRKSDGNFSRPEPFIKLSDIVPSIFTAQCQPAPVIVHPAPQNHLQSATLSAFRDSFLLPSIFAKSTPAPATVANSVTSTQLSCNSLNSLQDRILPKVAQYIPNQVDFLTKKDFFTDKKSRKPYDSNKRQKTTGPLNKKQRAALEVNITKLKNTPCCHKHCCQLFTSAKVLEIRTQFWGQIAHPTKSEEQKTFISNQLAKWMFTGNGSNLLFRYFYYDKEICAVAYEKLLPVAHGRLFAIRQDIKKFGEFSICTVFPLLTLCMSYTVSLLDILLVRTVICY